MTPHFTTILGIFITIVGYIIGLGAVTVIDLHGFLGRKSSYWTEATTRTHKVTKPLIWAGIVLVIIGQYVLYKDSPLGTIQIAHAVLAAVLILNGLFLSFRVSPFLLGREKENRASELLPQSWQNKIMVSFVFSFLGWWTSVFLFVLYIVSLSK